MIAPINWLFRHFIKNGDGIFTRSGLTGLAVLLVVATCLAALQYIIMFDTYGDRINHRYDNCEGIVDGFPALEMHQSRVLGPYTVDAVHNTTGWDTEPSYKAVTFVLLITYFFLVLLVSRSLWNSLWAAAWTGAASIAFFTLFIQGMVPYIWDYFNIIIVTLIIWAILRQTAVGFIGLIILVSIFNHQIALVFAVWLAIDSILLFRSGERLPTMKLFNHKFQLLLGTSLVIFGYFMMDYLENALLVVSPLQDEWVIFLEDLGVTGWRIGPLGSLLPFTYDMLKLTLTFDPELSLWAERFELSRIAVYFYLPLILFIPVVAIRAIWSAGGNIPRIGLLFFLLWVALFVISTPYEIRTWLPFVPFLVLIIPLTFKFPMHRFGVIDRETNDNND